MPDTVNDSADYTIVGGYDVEERQERIKRSISVSDLLTAAKREVAFVRYVQENASWLYDPTVVANAIRRYEQCWAVLKAENPANDGLIPPTDVYWVWHVHMLSPVHYQNDMLLMVGKVIDHKLLGDQEVQALLPKSVAIWEKRFPNEQYHVGIGGNGSGISPVAYQQKSNFDIASAVQRKWKFHEKVLANADDFTADTFLGAAIDRYVKFLALIQLYPGKELHPCNDFDLIWHAHQVHPSAYKHDCELLFGHTIGHSDDLKPQKGAKPGDASPGIDLVAELWLQHYGSSMQLPCDLSDVENIRGSTMIHDQCYYQCVYHCKNCKTCTVTASLTRTTTTISQS